MNGLDMYFYEMVTIMEVASNNSVAKKFRLKVFG